MSMEAVVLAGGRGTRLASVLQDLPKPMAPIVGEPFLKYLLNGLARDGFTRVILSVGYLADSIQGYFGDRLGDLEIAYCHEESPLGTGGAIREALKLVSADQAFVLNGDTFASVDYNAMQQQHIALGTVLSIALMPVPDTARYGAVEVDGQYIQGFVEKGRTGEGYINAGVYLVKKDLLESMDLPTRFSFEEEVLMKRLDLHPAAFVASGYFIDIGIPEDYARAQLELPGRLPL
jgi:D-glycero-alpha-D-manno-heptose 1-phosphate guanylyltransferase